MTIVPQIGMIATASILTLINITCPNYSNLVRIFTKIICAEAKKPAVLDIPGV